MNFRIELFGSVPSKKNLYGRGKNGALFLDKEVKAKINQLIMQAKAQWKQPPLEHPDMDVEFYVLDRRSDRDNKLGCLLDVLQEAGVIAKDNVARFNGTLVILPAIVGTREGVVVDLSPQQAALEVSA